MRSFLQTLLGSPFFHSTQLHCQARRIVSAGVNFRWNKVPSKGFATAEPQSNRSTAAGVIIGNELLSGKVKDENINTLSKYLFDAGVNLMRVEVIPDHKDTIMDAIIRLSPKHNYVFTTGGLGPSHTDITYQSVAAAFGRKLKIHEPTLERMKKFLATETGQKSPPNAAQMRMAHLPEGASVVEGQDHWVPLVVVENVFMFTGVPERFRSMLEANKEKFFIQPAKKQVVVYTYLKELDIAHYLHQVHEQFPELHIGSYPKFGGWSVGGESQELDTFSVMILIEGDDSVVVDKVAKIVAGKINGVLSR